jgi:hypothetical protein
VVLLVVIRCLETMYLFRWVDTIQFWNEWVIGPSFSHSGVQFGILWLESGYIGESLALFLRVEPFTDSELAD